MASVMIRTDGKLTDIDYSIMDGRIRSFTLDDELLFDEDLKISVDGWREKLIALVRERRLDVDDGKGLHAFIEPLLAQGETTLAGLKP